MLGAVGEARRIDVSQDLSVSAAHTDSDTEGLDILGCSSVDGTVSDEGSPELVGVTDDSVGLEMVVGVGGKGGNCRGDLGGDGPANEMLEISSVLGGDIVEMEGTVGPLGVGGNTRSESRLGEETERDSSEGGKGTFSGRSTYESSLSLVRDGSSDGVLRRGKSSTISGTDSDSASEMSLGTGSGLASSGNGLTSTGNGLTSTGNGLTSTSTGLASSGFGQ